MVSFHIVPVIVYLIVRVISYTFRFKREACSCKPHARFMGLMYCYSSLLQSSFDIRT